MLFQQLKTLLWRNTVLKRRAIISTLLEIIIPTLIILIIGYKSEYVDVEEETEEINNKPEFSLTFDDALKVYKEKMYFIEQSNCYLDLNFVFPPEFDKQKQNLFIENFKNSNNSTQFKLIESNQNFTLKSTNGLPENGNLNNQNVTNSSLQNINGNINNINVNTNATANATANPSANTNTNATANPSTNTNPSANANPSANPNANTNTNATANPSTNTNPSVNANPSANTNTNPSANNGNTDINTKTINNTPHMVNNEKRDLGKILEMKINIFDNEKDMKNGFKKLQFDIDEAYSNSDYNEENDDYLTNLDSIIYLGITFQSLTKYTINFICYDELYESLKGDMGTGEIYFVEALQAAIDKSIIKTLSNSPNIKDIQIKSKKMDGLGYELKYKSNSAHSYTPFFMLFYFVPCICSLLSNLVIEKESKIKESLIIIGLRKSTFWLSWAVTYGIIIIVSSTIVTIAMYWFKLFNLIHWSIVIIVLLVYGLSCCCISFILSTLLKKSKTANTVGIMIIVFFFVVFFVKSAVDKDPIVQLICRFTVSPIAFLSMFEYLIKLEDQGLSVSFLNMFKNKSLRDPFVGLISSLFIYFIMAIYLDNVLPQGNNFHRKWYFIITDFFRLFKRHKKNISPPIGNYKPYNPYIEKDPEDLRRAVQIKNIGKSFKVKRQRIDILRSIDFNAYYDEIFAILGHNGAGKTTLISIMTGILSASHGEVYYDDVPITGNETEICQQFGYCPQFDTFNNSLTLAEHVRLFAGIKNVKVNIDEILRDIDLLDKKNNYPKQLSGGQRRKLCITLALLGSPKYVFLDEPTTGLDPYSRKNIWELLSQKKKGRVMFVTTHYMDEADLLADRKMIISNGNISCLGTSLFLKNRFNMNYSLDIHCKDSRDTSLADDLIEYFCPGSSHSKTISKTNINGHLEQNRYNSNTHISAEYITTYLLPMKFSKSFKEIFEHLNKMIKSTRNSVANFSLTAPTLEELFIKLEKNSGNTQNIGGMNNNHSMAIDMNNDSERLLSNLEPIFGKAQLPKFSAVRQIWSIVKLRIKIFLRNKTFALLYTLLPLCFIMVCIYYENKEIQSVNEPRTFQPLEIKPSLYESGQWFKDSSSTGQAMDIINQAENASKLKFNPVNYENELTIASKKLTHDAFYIGGIKGTTDAQQNLQFTIYNNDTFNFATQMALNLLSNGILKQNNINEQISITLQPFDNAEEAKFSENDDNKVINIAGEQLKMYMEQMLIVAIAITTSISVSIYGPFTVKEREDGITHQLFLNGTKRINYWIGVLISDGICLIVPLLLIGVVGIFSNLDIYQPRVITYTATVTFICGISSLLHQYVVCYFFKKYEKVSSLFIIINPVLSLCMGVYALIISIISSIVNTNEEESNKNKKGGFGEYFFYLLLFLYAPSMIVFLYIKLSSFIFQHKIKITQEEIAQFVLRKDVKDIYAKSISESEKSKLIANLFFKDRIPTISEIFKSKEDKFLVLLIVAVVFLVIYAVLLYLLERSKARIVKKNSEYTEEERKLKNKMLENGPRDVYNEWWRVKQALNNGSKFANRIALKVFQLNKDFSLKASDVKKLNNNNNNKKKNDNDKNGKANLNEKDQNENEENGKKSAFQKMDNRIIYDRNKKKNINRIVDDVTFGVDVGECLGLLGPNGAGKTTSISMITGLLSHTHGTVVYGNKDLSTTDMADLSLGYTAQYDSLWKLLTVKETIQFYLNICGYPRKDIPRYTKALIEACGIELHTNKKVSEISGGTKRKLSLIVSICSSPNYLILDEPSAGMDPFTRRYMWKLISELKKVRETATILTTHSTEEAEALCDRIAILIKGRLVCVDTPRSIKMNHSNSYILEVFTNYPDQFEKEFVRKYNIFGLYRDEKYDLESSFSYQKYSVKMRTENIANVFSMMEYAKERRYITQYNFGQYSLEQVFINFVNNAE
ncbi:hypothetical protein U3516DRAFT_608426 [Neocallimastix sp. 'constans']